MLSWLEFFAEHWNTPAGLLAVLLLFFFILQLIGKLLERIGKNVPKIMKINEALKKHKQQEETLNKNVEELARLSATVSEMQKRLDETFGFALSTWVDNQRNTILNFANRLVKNDKNVSNEEFKHIMSLHQDYEDTLAKYNMSNGQVDVAYRIITDDYKRRLENREFIEDIRGY